MSGKDFARSVVCSVHTNQIEEYLAKVDAMPAQLTAAKVRCSQRCFSAGDYESLKCSTAACDTGSLTV